MAGFLLAISTPAFAAAGPDKAFTVGNYPVEATAKDAVTAKEKALADGQQAALRSLLKRLVPVTAYGRIGALKTVKASDLIEGVAVRSERNSSTQYIASLDFSFEPRAVRDLLRREGVPYVDVQAPQVVIVPVYQAPATGQGATPELGEVKGARTWGEAWNGLDLVHALTPAKLEKVKPAVTAGTMALLREGDGSSLRTLAGEYASELVLLAIAEPDLPAKKLNVTLAGRDAVGPFVLNRSYRLVPQDLAYTAELAAVVALGTLEGRWKATRFRGGSGRVTGGNLGSDPVQLLVEFRSMQQWQEIRRMLQDTPGVEDLQIGGLSARGADVALRFPGGGDELAEVLQDQGLQLRNVGGTWLVRFGN